MKNTDKTIPYEPSPAELARFRSRSEKTFSSDFNRIDDENLAGEPSAINTGLILILVMVLVVALILMMVQWGSPASFASVSWNG